MTRTWNPSSSLLKMLLPVLCALVLSVPAEAVKKETHMIPMRDGILLSTDIFFPPVVTGKLPVLLLRTPYGKKDIGEVAAPLITVHNFIVAIQDTRGRYDSEGFSASFMDDGPDGYDTVKWLAAQPWSTGKIGTFGVSAMGITQYTMAKWAPPGLACQHVMAAAPDLYRYVAYQGGGFKRAVTLGWVGGQKFPIETLKLMLANVDYSGIWSQMDLSVDYEKVNYPVLHMAGWYDMFLQGNIDAYLGIRERGGPEGRDAQLLVIGPWTHMGWAAIAGPKQGALEYPANSAIDLFSSIPAWFKECLTGARRGFLTGPRVRYYVMGDVDDPDAPGNEWRTADDWPVPADITSFYFHADGVLDAAVPDPADAKIEFVADPADPVPTNGGANLILRAGPRDQSEIEARDDVLVFSTPALEEPLEITGPIRAVLRVSTDAVDADFAVRLTDVYPDGRSMLITDGLVRFSHSEGFHKRVAMTPGQIYELEVDLWSTSIVINKGHQLRVSVSGSNFPRFDVNMHNGRYFNFRPGVLEQAYEEGIDDYASRPDLAEDAVVGNYTIYLDGEHGSRIELPVVKAR